jgi:hypothetical protein
VGTRPSGPDILFTAFTAICRIVCLETHSNFNSSTNIQYTLQRMRCALSTSLTDQCASMETLFVVIPVVATNCQNSLLVKFVPAS